MKVHKRLATVSAGTVLAISSIMGIGFAPMASAASTVTWTGGGSDGNWSTTANWAGGVAPVNGDSVVIDNSASFAHGSTDDIASLSLDTLTFANNASGGGVENVALGQDLTVTSAITQASSDTTTSDVIGSTSGSHTLTLGGDVTVKSSAGITLGASSGADGIALAGHTLTFTDYGGSTAHGVVIDAVISGSGNVVYDGVSSDYQIDATNTYSGTTHLVQSNLGVDQTGGTAPFGTSTITIEPGSSAGFYFASSATISNPIVITGTTNGSPVTSLSFGPSGAASGAITLTVPNITLNGDTRFANDGTTTYPVTVNLAGTTANGHCVEYLPNKGFENGPSYCVVTATVQNNTTTPTKPKAPDTGFAKVSATIAPVLAATVLAAGALLFIARSMKPASKKR